MFELPSFHFRPHVVNALWLAECFRQARHVGEEQFLSPHFLLSDIELPKLRISGRCVAHQVTVMILSGFLWLCGHVAPGYHFDFAMSAMELRMCGTK